MRPAGRTLAMSGLYYTYSLHRAGSFNFRLKLSIKLKSKFYLKDLSWMQKYQNFLSLKASKMEKFPHN
jgi:hypothetical protein